MRIQESSVILFLKNLAFTILVPGMVSVLVPLLLHKGEFYYFHLLSVPAVALLLFGALAYLWCLWDFAQFGRGTPAPFDAPRRLVVRGLYRYTRNPMYLAALSIIMGWVLHFAEPLLLLYWLVIATCFHLYVLFYEEPHLLSLYGAQYSGYCNRVNRWLPLKR
jgi:protein-S-isoprenylcysteine O-methyltransferase Ste14